MTRRHPSRGRSPSRRSPRSSSYCPFSGPWRWACTCPTGRRPPRTRRPRTFPRSSRGGRRRPAGGPTWPSCARRRRGRRSPTAGWTAAPGWCSCPSGGPWSWSSGSTGAASDMKDEVTAADSSSRAPLLVLLLAALAWLVAAGLLGLVASIQLHSPRFLSDCPVLTYGRMAALAETAFVYGWLANAGLALALWILGRLAGEALPAQGWAVGGAVFWNLGVAAALGGVATGDATGFALLGLSAYVHMILLFSYSAIAVTGILSWSGRMRRVPYASQWYAAAALFTFPWILSIAHVMLFSAPARGVVQAVAAGWYAQCAWTLWLAPVGRWVAYSVVPRATGRVLPSYEFASLGFWCLVFVGGLTGGRHSSTAGSSGLCVRGATLGPLGFPGRGAIRHLDRRVVVMVIGPADQESNRIREPVAGSDQHASETKGGRRRTGRVGGFAIGYRSPSGGTGQSTQR